VFVVAFDWSDLGDLALAVFLFAVGLSLAYAFLRLGETFGRLSSLIKGTEQEVLPVVSKVGVTVDRVNDQMQKVDQMTDSAVDAVDSVDTAIRAVSHAITRPVQKLSGLAAGVGTGLADLRANRSWAGAVQAGKAAASHREEELARELRDAGRAT
jgi:hypothetical protein